MFTKEIINSWLSQILILTMDDENSHFISILLTDTGLLQRDWWWLYSSTCVCRAKLKKSSIRLVDSVVFERSSSRGVRCHVALQEWVTSRRGFYLSENPQDDMKACFRSVFLWKQNPTAGELQHALYFLACFDFTLIKLFSFEILWA